MNSNLNQTHKISIRKYALSILRFLKIARFVKHLLYRAHCIEVKDGQFVKDLSLLNVPASDVILIDVTTNAF